MSRRHHAGHPVIVGAAGDGMSGDTSWAANSAVVAVGRDGEERTGRLLDAYARKHRGVGVLHNLMCPHPKLTLNVDHVVVTGRNVLVIDTKVWAPGFYWTFRGKSFRGLKRFKPAEKKSVQLGVECIERYLNQRNVAAKVRRPAWLAVWVSRGGNARFTFLRMPGSKVVDARTLKRRLKRAAGTTPADPLVVAALAGLREH